MPFELKQEKKKKPNLDILKFFSSKYLGPVYLGPEEQEQPWTLREGLIEVVALTVVGRVNVNFCIN